MESLLGIREQYSEYLIKAELFFTAIFTIEYMLRVFCIRRPFSYMFSFFGIIDLLAIVPTLFNFFTTRYTGFCNYPCIKSFTSFSCIKIGAICWRSRFIS